MELLVRFYTADVFHFYSIIITIVLIILLLCLELFGDTKEMKKGKFLIYPTLVILGLLFLKTVINLFS